MTSYERSFYMKERKWKKIYIKLEYPFPKLLVINFLTYYILFLLRFAKALNWPMLQESISVRHSPQSPTKTRVSEDQRTAGWGKPSRCPTCGALPSMPRAWWEIKMFASGDNHASKIYGMLGGGRCSVAFPATSYSHHSQGWCKGQAHAEQQWQRSSQAVLGS